MIVKILAIVVGVLLGIIVLLLVALNQISRVALNFFKGFWSRW